MIWNTIKKPFTKFNDWVASIAPGLKVKIASAFGALAAFCSTAQEFITGLPLDTFISGTKIALIGGALFTVVFWFRMLTR